MRKTITALAVFLVVCASALKAQVYDYNTFTKKLDISGAPAAAGGGAGIEPHSEAFVSQTSVSITEAEHGFAHKNLAVVCYDDSTPEVRIYPLGYTVHPTTFEVIVSFSPAETGRCVVFGSGGAGTVTNTGGALTDDLPVFGAGVNDVKIGTKTGTGNELVASQSPTITTPTLAGATLTAQLLADNLGIEFDESDTNPTCASGNFTVFADLSDLKLKKCEDGVVSDLDAGGGSALEMLNDGVSVEAATTSINVAPGSYTTVGMSTISGAVTYTPEVNIAALAEALLVPWQVGMAFEETPATGEFALPLPVNNQCGGNIDAVSVSITALTKGSSTMTFNVIRYSAAGVSAGDLFSAAQSYSNAGDNRQSFATNQNATGIAASDYFRLNIVTVNGQDDFSVTVQGKCENTN